MYRTVQEHSSLIGYLVAVLHCALLAILPLLLLNTVRQLVLVVNLLIIKLVHVRQHVHCIILHSMLILVLKFVFNTVLLHTMLKTQAKVVSLDVLYYLHLIKPDHVKTIVLNHTMQTGVLIYVC